MCTGFEPQAFFEELQKRKNSDLNAQKSDKSEQKGQKGPILKPLRGQKGISLIGGAKNRFAKMSFPQKREAYFLKKCESQNELEHQEYEKWCCNLDV